MAEVLEDVRKSKCPPKGANEFDLGHIDLEILKESEQVEYALMVGRGLDL